MFYTAKEASFFNFTVVRKRFFIDKNSGMEGTTRRIYSFSFQISPCEACHEIWGVQKGSRDYQSSRRAGRERDQAEPLGEVSPSHSTRVKWIHAASFFLLLESGLRVSF